MLYHRLFESTKYTNWGNEMCANREYSYYCDKFYNCIVNAFVCYLLRLILIRNLFFNDIFSGLFPDICLVLTFYFNLVSAISIVKIIQIDHFRLNSMNFVHQRKNIQSIISDVQIILENIDFFKKKKNKIDKLRNCLND